MSDPETLIRLQLELECIGVSAGKRLTRIAGEDPDEMARAYFYKIPDGKVIAYFAEDVHERTLTDTLGSLDEYFSDTEELCKELGGHHVERYCSFVVPAVKAIDSEATLVTTGTKSRAEIQVQGEQAGFCESVRENGKAAEAWAFVDARFRRQGHATKLVHAWAETSSKRGRCRSTATRLKIWRRQG